VGCLFEYKARYQQSNTIILNGMYWHVPACTGVYQYIAYTIYPNFGQRMSLNSFTTKYTSIAAVRYSSLAANEQTLTSNM